MSPDNAPPLSPVVVAGAVVEEEGPPVVTVGVGVTGWGVTGGGGVTVPDDVEVTGVAVVVGADVVLVVGVTALLGAETVPVAVASGEFVSVGELSSPVEQPIDTTIAASDGKTEEAMKRCVRVAIGLQRAEIGTSPK